MVLAAGLAALSRLAVMPDATGSVGSFFLAPESGLSRSFLRRFVVELNVSIDLANGDTDSDR